METPTTTHLKATKQIIYYIKGTFNFGLWFSTRNDYKLVGYSDNDGARDKDDRKSTSEFVFFMGNTTFIWMLKKQSIVTLLTSEAEYVAAISCI